MNGELEIASKYIKGISICSETRYLNIFELFDYQYRRNTRLFDIDIQTGGGMNIKPRQLREKQKRHIGNSCARYGTISRVDRRGIRIGNFSTIFVLQQLQYTFVRRDMHMGNPGIPALSVIIALLSAPSKIKRFVRPVNGDEQRN